MVNSEVDPRPRRRGDGVDQVHGRSPPADEGTNGGSCLEAERTSPPAAGTSSLSFLDACEARPLPSSPSLVRNLRLPNPAAAVAAAGLALRVVNTNAARVVAMVVLASTNMVFVLSSLGRCSCCAC